MFLLSTIICEASKTNSADPDQTAPVGSTMFASMLMLNRHFQMQLFCWRLNNVFCVYTEIMAQDDTVTFE